MNESKKIKNGQAEMRDFLKKIKQDAESPEYRLKSPKFLEDSKKAINRLKDIKGNKFIKYDLSELYS